MIILFVTGVLLGAVVVVFALQNIAVITVTFFTWHLTGSLAVVLILAILSGILITLLMVLPETINASLKYRSFKKEIEKVKEELRKQKELTVFAKHTPPTPEEIAKIKEEVQIDNLFK